jgi:catalase
MTTPPNNLAIAQEYIPPEEAATIQEMVKLSIELLDQKPNQTLREQHPKSHGCLKAEFIVEQVPDSLQHGIFSTPRTYPAWIRFSSGSSSPQADVKGDARGMAIKILGVEGEKLLEPDKHTETQDFILLNYPVFFLKNAQDALEFSQAVRAVKDLPPFPPLKLLVLFLKYLMSHPQQAAIVKALKKLVATDLLQEQYWSTIPYKLGPHAIKFSTQPSTHHSSEPATLPPNPPDNFLREALVKHLSEQDAYFDFLVQVQTNPVTMPIEDPTVEWKESESPFVKVATIKIPQQAFDTSERQQLDENLSYNPWHALPEHQPLGGINRLRKQVYKAISTLRHQLNQQPAKEPTAKEFAEQP